MTERVIENLVGVTKDTPVEKDVMDHFRIVFFLMPNATQGP